MSMTSDANAVADAGEKAAPVFVPPSELPTLGIYQKGVSGRWRRVKSTILALVLGGFYLLPWLRWDRGPELTNQAVLFNFATARSYVFGLVFRPEDLYLLTLVLLSGAFGLFLTNSIVGRVWCGFTCPQTLWADLFFMIERWIEGDRNVRLREDTGHRTSAGRWRRMVKNVVWGLVALITGLTIISYFTDAYRLWGGFFTGDLSVVTGLMVAVFSILTFALAGYAREKVCLHMCPWPRFQSAMLDIDTQVVAYQDWRGEPRGKKAKKRRAQAESSGLADHDAAEAELGDCVDCGLCVAVCPTGIDIRDGLQLGCIGCALCVDACHGVMKKLDRETDLIRFISDRDLAQAAIDKGKHVDPALAEAIKHKRPRVRVIGFGAMFLITLMVFVAVLATRGGSNLTIAPVRSPPFIMMSDGSIRNVYGINLTIRDAIPDGAVLAIEGLGDAIMVRRQDAGAGQSSEPVLAPDELSQGDIRTRLLVTVPRDQVPSGRTPITVVLRDHLDGHEINRHGTYFWAPETAQP